MIVLHNKTTIPRDGFTYYYLPPSKPEAAFNIPVGASFTQSLQKLMDYRRLNPWLNLPSDAASCEHELVIYTFARLRSTLGLKYALQFFSAGPEDDPEVAAQEEQIKKNSLNRLQSSQPADVVGVVGEGISIIKDWLGDGGKPVARELAEHRAKVCEVCPMNQPANWLERMAASVAGMVKKHVEFKNEMKLAVTNEAKLQTCAACHCNLSTKVWVPIQYIAAHIKEETKAKLADGKDCWQLKEMQA